LIDGYKDENNRFSIVKENMKKKYCKDVSCQLISNRWQIKEEEKSKGTVTFEHIKEGKKSKDQ